MAKNKRYGKLSKKDELRGVGELVLQGQLMVGNSSDYVKRDWGEQYKQALLKSKQVNELKLTDFEFPSNNESELNIESEEQLPKGKEEQIEVEQEISGTENTQEQDFDALLAGNEIETTQETEKDRSNEKNKGGNHGLIEQDKQINKKTIKNDISTHETSEESQPSSNSQHDVQILEEWDNSESKRQRNRTGVTMKEAIENHEEEMMMKKKITGLSALVSSKSPKKSKQLLQQAQLKDKEQNSNNYRNSEGKENNSNSNSIGFNNCSESQKDLMKKIFADRDSAEEENTFMEIESDRKENSQTFDIYAQMRAQKMQSLKMKKKQEERQKQSDEKDENKRKVGEYAGEFEMKRKQEQFQEEYVKRKVKEQEELKKKQQLAEDSLSGMESAKGATNDGKLSKSYQNNQSNSFLRECFQLNTPPPHLASINKSQKLDQNIKGSSSLSFLVSNSAETSVNEAEKDRMRKVTLKPSVGVSAPVAGGIYDLIKNSRTSSSTNNQQQQQQQQQLQQQQNIPSKITPIIQQQYGQREFRQQQQQQFSGQNLSNTTTKTSTMQLLSTIYSKKN